MLMIIMFGRILVVYLSRICCVCYFYVDSKVIHLKLKVSLYLVCEYVKKLKVAVDSFRCYWFALVW